jgi:bifunctional DNase/RNase
MTATSQLVPIQFHKIMQTRSYTVIIMGTEQKKFAIYTEAGVGRTLQGLLTQTERQRPMTYDLLHSLMQGLHTRVLQIVINDVQETVYFSRIFLEQERDGLRHIVEIDCRPSDAITLALMNDAPVYCTRDVLDKAVPVEE